MQAINPKDLETAVIKLSDILKSKKPSSTREAKEIVKQYGPKLPQDRVEKLIDSGILSKSEVELANFLYTCRNHNILRLDAYTYLVESKTSSGAIVYNLYTVLEANINRRPIHFTDFHKPITKQSELNLLKSYLAQKNQDISAKKPFCVIDALFKTASKFSEYLNDFEVYCSPQKSISNLN